MPSTSRELLQDQIKDLYSAELQLIKALPRVARAASDDDLKAAILSHLKETREHAQRLEEAAGLLDAGARGKKCAGMVGLLEEGKEALSEGEEGPVLDSAIITAARKVEHYEMAAYQCALDLADRLGEHAVVRLLEKTLEEEEAADQKLEQIAESTVLAAAVNHSESEDEG